jgi:hypothetical protein
MAASSTTPDFPITTMIHSALPRGLSRPRRRRIDRSSGRALEILGHAIEYLTDEFGQNGCMSSSDKGPLDAVQLLMAVNREIYFECPEIPTIGERMFTIFGIN